MSTPAQPQQGQTNPASKPAAPRHRRPPHERYRRSSAVVDDRPDGKPIIFGYGRHMTKREKDRALRLIAYCVLEAVVATCLAILVVALVYIHLIYPDNTIATVSSHGITGRINRQSVDTMTNYFTYVQQQQSANGQTSLTNQDPKAQAIQQLQQWQLTAIEAKRQFGIVPSDSDINAEYSKNASSAGGTSSFNASINAAGLSVGDFKKFFASATVVENKVGAALLKGKPTAVEQWDYARIEVTSKITATQILQQIGKNKNPAAEFKVLAKTKSTDTQTSSAGGDLGWERPTDTSSDTLLSTTLLQTLKSMEKSHTVFRLYNSGSNWYVLEYLGHDLKHKLSSTQIQADQTAAVNAWGTPLLNKALFNPPLPAVQGGLTATQ